MRPNLQLALDLVNVERAIQIAQVTESWVDWIEAGTPLILSEGLKVVKSLKTRFPLKKIVADVKIADAATLITTLALESSPDILTVLSAAADQTIRKCCELAHQKECRVLGDHLSTQISIADSQRMEDLGVDYVGIHLPKDAKRNLLLDSLEALLTRSKMPIVLAGGIDLPFLKSVTGWPIYTVVVGEAIINQMDPASAAKEFAGVLNQWPG